LDSGRAGNPWHRLVLELTVPDRTAVRLFSFTSDVLHPDLAAVGLLQQPIQPGGWQAAVPNVDEWLIQSPPGRYLYLAILLQGPGDRTPAIQRIYVYAERQSSLRYLPALYHEDETSRHLLDRLLSLFDTIYGELESEIEQFALHMDIAGAPPEFLPWLATWFDLQLEQGWTDVQKRQFLRNAVELYSWRGTVRGLRQLLRLHTGLAEPLPHIVEHFRTPAQGGSANQPQTSAAWDDAAQTVSAWLGVVPDAAHHFTILLPARLMDTPEKRGVLRRLIDAGIPAHTHYTLRPSYPGVWLGSTAARASALGLDTVLGSLRPWRLPAADAEPQPTPALNMLLPGTAPPRLRRARLGSARLQRSDRICQA
jgi:phage tail-like protein